MNLQDAIEQARAEIQQEAFREAVEREKTRLRAVKWWHKFVPFKIIIIIRRK